MATQPGTGAPSRAASLPEHYAAELAARQWHSDPAQLAVVTRLEQLRVELRGVQRGTALLERLRQRLWPQRGRSGPRGIYLWGGVGRGKTWLMDLFYDSLTHTPRRAACTCGVASGAARPG